MRHTFQNNLTPVYENEFPVITQWLNEQDQNESSEFDKAYSVFRKNMEEEGFLTDEEWKQCFNSPREIQIGLRHEEDFE